MTPAAVAGRRPWPGTHGVLIGGVSRRQALLQRLKALREIPGEEREAEIRWGASPNFEYVTKRRDEPRVTIHFPPDDPPPPDEAPIPFTEIDKEVETIRVENPDDEEQWVEVERRVWSIFENAENGKHYLFTYLNDS